MIFRQKFSIRGEKILIIWIDTHSTANLPPLAILKKKSTFFQKNLLFSKNLNFERFEKSYNFSLNLQQIGYNLVEKCSRWESPISRRTEDILYWRIIKTHALNGWFSFLWIMAENKYFCWRLSVQLAKSLFFS